MAIRRTRLETWYDMIQACGTISTIAALVIPGLIDAFSKTFLGKFWGYFN